MILAILLPIVLALGPADEVLQWPGYPTQNFKTYSGYIDLVAEKQKIHYIFLESQNDPAKDPVIFWLGGGPGCTCLLGFIREIGPYVIQNEKKGLDFEENKYALNKIANVVFLDVPAGVGYSTVSDNTYEWTDENTGRDAYAAILLWFNAFTTFQDHSYWIGGESYSGMYVPYTAKYLVDGNAQLTKPIKLKGILVGNGVLVNTDGYIDYTQLWFQSRHQLLDTVRGISAFHECSRYPNSASCKYVENHPSRKRINIYNVYDNCWGDSSGGPSSDDAPCIDAGPLLQYFNQDEVKTAAKVPKEFFFAPCNNDIFEKYQRDQRGSTWLIPYLNSKGVKILQYSGNQDSVVSSLYTQESLKKVEGLQVTKKWTPFALKSNNNLGGWITEYNFMTLYVIRGAGHLVPYDQREAAFQMFTEFLARP